MRLLAEVKETRRNIVINIVFAARVILLKYAVTRGSKRRERKKIGNKVKATALGVLASLLGVVLWVIFGALLEMIAGWAGAIVGVLFILVYRKINAEDKSIYQIVLAICLIIVEIFAAEMITLAIIAANAQISFAYAIALPEIQLAMVIDLLIGYGLSFLVFGMYMYTSRKKTNKAAELKKVATNMQQTTENIQPSATENMQQTTENIQPSATENMQQTTDNMRQTTENIQPSATENMQPSATEHPQPDTTTSATEHPQSDTTTTVTAQPLSLTTQTTEILSTTKNEPKDTIE